MKEIEEFTLLAEFVDAFEPLVEPRAATPLSDDERKLLSRIANGSSSADDRDKAVRILSENSVAMEFFASALNGN